MKLTTLIALVFLAVSSQVHAETLNFRALVDESLVVRPAAFQPPQFGTGSPGNGVCDLHIDTETLEYEFDLQIRGIDPSDIDNAIAPNFTGVHVHRGQPSARGPVVIDVHHFARQEGGEDGFERTDDGFRLRVSGVLAQQQGELKIAFTPADIIDSLRNGEAFVAVHTTENDLTRTGAIRGNFVETQANAFVRGDCDGDGIIGLTDPVALLGWLFLSQTRPPCIAACDFVGTTQLDVSAAVYGLAFLFLGGPQPPEPHPDCGIDPSGLDCAEPSPACQ
ncbi:MAG: CHRD domain-containing protein [Planctomycetota bacterium]